MIYFDAREVFASLLSCPLLNCDENYLFDLPEKDPFIGPPKSLIIGDITTGQCYRKTHKALVKNPGVDMILPTIVAIGQDTGWHLRSASNGATDHITWSYEA